MSLSARLSLSLLRNSEYERCGLTPRSTAGIARTRCVVSTTFHSVECQTQNSTLNASKGGVVSRKMRPTTMERAPSFLQFDDELKLAILKDNMSK